jgi:replicative DNA helicase
MTTTAPDNTVMPLRGEDGESLAYRTPPHNAEIEAALLGALLTNNRAFEKVSEILEPGHFYEPVHGRIYEAAARLIERGQVASPLTLRHFFEKDEGLAQVGGGQYLFDLAASVVSVANLVDYARTIHDMYLRRQLIGLGEDVVNEAYSHDIDKAATDQIEDAEQRLYDLATVGETERGIVSLKHASVVAIEEAEQAYKRKGHVVGVTTGLRELDQVLGGLHPSDLIILAGRPSMGKTALATNIAYNAARADRPPEDSGGSGTHRVLFFSLEMSSEQLAARLISQESGIPSDRVRRGDINDDQFQRFVVASQEMSRISMFIDDTPAITVSTIRTRARRLKRQSGLDLIVIDYLQLLQSSNSRRIENRVQEISEITRGLKTLAKELAVPVVALSQLSRQVENREDKRPQLADLRESGSIEQDADVVMFIYREEYYKTREHPEKRERESDQDHQNRVAEHNAHLKSIRNITQLIIAKQRHGPTSVIELYFDGSLTKFADYDPHHSAADQF